MTTTPRNITVATFTWQGRLIEVRYEADWLAQGYTAQLELETLEPYRAPLPVTETGYRLQFIDRETVEAAGGPIAWAVAWLDAEADRSCAWIAAEVAARQLWLF